MTRETFLAALSPLYDRYNRTSSLTYGPPLLLDNDDDADDDAADDDINDANLSVGNNGIVIESFCPKLIAS
jgi:hypothetical protein